MRLATTFFVVCMWAAVAAQPALEPIRALYASADYEGVLAAIDRLPPDERASNQASLDLLRVLCLIALGRPSEATPLIEGILTSDPFYDPGPEVPPRIRSTFNDARRRLLPRIARALYLDAKDTFDKKAFPEAIAKFERVRRLSAHPDAKGDPDLVDLTTVADGFLELSRAALPKPTAPEPNTTKASTPPAASPGKPRPASPATPPIVIRQNMPPWTQAVAGAQFMVELRGSIEVEIDATGTVVSSRMVQPVHLAYDKLLVEAARHWKYEPARRGGEAIASTKRVDFVLRPRD